MRSGSGWHCSGQEKIRSWRLSRQLNPQGDTLSRHAVGFRVEKGVHGYLDEMAKGVFDTPEETRSLRNAMVLKGDVLPVFFRAVLANDGAIMIQTGAAKGTDDVPWALVSREGTTTATAWLKHNDRPLLLEGDRLWVAEADEDEVESLVLYRIGGTRQSREATKQ